VGQVVLSEDACGTNAPACAVQITKPSATATVRDAILFCASTGLTGYLPKNGDVTLNGTPVSWDQIVPSAINSFNARVDVTSLVKPVGDPAPLGLISFTITENPTLNYDGCILKVIWDDPTTTQNSILIYFGAQETTGDTFVVNFAQPLATAAFLTPLEFSLGISFGHQPSFPSQFSRVDVNGARLTTSAGGEDDGTGQNGALITVGGTGDSPANPPAMAPPVSPSVPDDELYDLRPFLNVGDTSMTIFTLNPSNDDNIFIANLFLRNVTVVTAALLLTPPAATNPVGTQHCVTATATAANGDPTPNVTVIFSVTGANPQAPTSRTTDANGQATFCYTGTIAGSDAISAFADANNNGSFDPGEARGEALKVWLAGPPAKLVLTPIAATNTVGDPHTVTGTVTDAFGNPVQGVTVRFTVQGAAATAATPPSGSGTTNASGVATFTFTAALPGDNVITAYVDANNNNSLDAGEPVGNPVNKTWILPVGTALCEIKVTDGGHITAVNGDSANFGGVARSDDAGNASGNEEYQDHGPAMPMNVKSTEILAITCTPDFKTATVYGNATIDGSGSYAFRIRMTDNNEPGKGYDVYGILLSNGYNSGDKVLDGGNIQIHKL
jgi:hypothetical protein